MKKFLAVVLTLALCAALFCSCAAPREREPHTGVVVIFTENTEVRSVTLARGKTGTISTTGMNADGSAFKKGGSMSFDSLAGEWLFTITLWGDDMATEVISTAQFKLTVEEGKETKVYVDGEGRIYIEVAE